MTVAGYINLTGMTLSNYISIARPSHWFKNLFVIPGVIISATLTRTPIQEYAWDLVTGLVSVSLIASANYVVNEWLDAQFDRHHPLKRQRPAVQGRVKGKFVYTEYVTLALAGLAIAWTVSQLFFIISIAFLLAGLTYNLKPVRTKDRIYLDVISESVNNAIRLILGWTIVTNDSFPPSSLIFAFWMGGAFLMSVKRFSEYRFIVAKGGSDVLGAYRRSFNDYTENRLLLSSLFYAINSSFFLAVFLVKYRIEYILTLPLFAGLFTWYLYIGMKPQSVAQTPEMLHTERPLLIFLTLLVVLLTLLTFVDIPPLDQLLQDAIDSG